MQNPHRFLKCLFRKRLKHLNSGDNIMVLPEKNKSICTVSAVIGSLFCFQNGFFLLKNFINQYKNPIKAEYAFFPRLCCCCGLPTKTPAV
ncbi:MAG: hypothetical protein Q4E77_05605 [Conchiformibius sp.]|nr:hypothetical protein [Conchiformibius sp.]